MLGKLPQQGRPTNFYNDREGPTALAVGAGGDCLDILSLLSRLSSFSLSLLESSLNPIALRIDKTP